MVSLISTKKLIGDFCCTAGLQRNSRSLKNTIFPCTEQLFCIPRIVVHWTNYYVIIFLVDQLFRSFKKIIREQYFQCTTIPWTQNNYFVHYFGTNLPYSSCYEIVVFCLFLQVHQLFSKIIFSFSFLDILFSADKQHLY